MSNQTQLSTFTFETNSIRTLLLTMTLGLLQRYLRCIKYIKRS